MAYPPPVPPATRTDATVMATNHPSDHNLIAGALGEILNHISVMENALYPIGVMSTWGGDVPPNNHELCRGQEVSRSTYPEVFSLVGSRFGPGNGSTTFNMPDMRGRYPIGFNPGGPYFSIGVGEKYGSSDAIVVNHTHIAPNHIHAHNFGTLSAGDHWHQPSNAGSFLAGGGVSGGPPQGFLGYPGLRNDSSSFIEIGGTGNSGEHTHVIGGGIGGTDIVLQTDGASGAVAPTNANLPPSISFNFMMRMH